MVITENFEGHLKTAGSVFLKYEFHTEKGQKFKFGAMIENVPEELREKLYWLETKLNIALQGIAIDLATYLGEI